MSDRNRKLFLLPNFIAESKEIKHLCEAEIETVRNLKYFITEGKSALFQLLKKCNHPDLENIEWIEFNEHHTGIEKEIQYLFHLGTDIGLLSEGGLPSLADPGYKIVRYAHEKNFRVIPLPGPGSIYMAVMASGLNAQQFVFHGYLPRDKEQLSKKIKDIVKDILKNNYSHFFIEAPYRNQKILELLLNLLPNHFLLTLSCNIQSTDELIQTKKILDWKNNPHPNIQKKPCIFGIGT